ncbi:MAG: hypothetical protein KJZ66_04450, partial [Candidatus Kuenenia stuttgartiensis]|nr:hypothetical protein [Candidatus Kuenenia stuttgartiensis]
DREVKILNDIVLGETPAGLTDRTGNYWHLWITKSKPDFANLPPIRVRRTIFARSCAKISSNNRRKSILIK